MKPRTYTVPVIDLESFRELVLDNLVHGMEHYTPRDICRSFIEGGVQKFDRETLGAFVKSLTGKVCLLPMAVDINDSMFYWMVYGTEAMLVLKDPKSVDNM
jgi:hypothetical protein